MAQRGFRYDAFLCPRYDLNVNPFLFFFFALVHRSHWCYPQHDSVVQGDELLFSHLPAV